MVAESVGVSVSVVGPERFHPAKLLVALHQKRQVVDEASLEPFPHPVAHEDVVDALPHALIFIRALSPVAPLDAS